MYFFFGVQDWGCCGRERTFRNDTKLKGRKDFFKPPSAQTPVCRFPAGGVSPARIVFFLSQRFDSWFRLTEEPARLCPSCRGEALGWCVFVCVWRVKLFLETSPSALPFNSRATEGLNIPAPPVCVCECVCVCACVFSRTLGLHYCERNGCDKKDGYK